jgi:hypothetical protein
MRSVSLSNSQIISLLNRHFVNVFVSNEDFTPEGKATAADKAELRRIFQEGHAAKLSVGTVHVYLLDPDGRLRDSLHVAQAAQGKPLITLLEKNIKALDVRPGDPIVKPAVSPAPKALPEDLRLHIVSRYLERRGDTDALTGQGDNRGNWSDNPGENWVMLNKGEWSRFLPPSGARTGDTWTIPHNLSTRLWNHFYPPTESNDISKNRIQSQSLQATLVSMGKHKAQVRLEGSLVMGHPFYHKDDDNVVRATAVGYVVFESGSRRIKAFQMVTEEATYGAQNPLPFGTAVNLRP